MVLLPCVLEPVEPLTRYQSHQWLQFGTPMGSWMQPVRPEGGSKHPLRTSTRFSPHQDKQSMPMTDPRQTERNYGNGILGDTVSLNPSVSSPSAADCCEVGVSAANPGPAFSQHNLCNCTRGCWLKLRKVQRRRHEKDNAFHPTRDWEKRLTAAIWELNCWKYLHSCLSDFETRRH